MERWICSKATAPGEGTLRSGYQKRAHSRRQGRRAEDPLKIREQRRHGIRQRNLNALREEGRLKRVRGARDEHQHIEQGQRRSNVPGADPRDTGGVRQGANQVDDKRQTADHEQVGIHRLKPTLLHTRSADM
jgi:hypothetical protein